MRSKVSSMQCSGRTVSQKLFSTLPFQALRPLGEALASVCRPKMVTFLGRISIRLYFEKCGMYGCKIFTSGRPEF